MNLKDILNPAIIDVAVEGKTKKEVLDNLAKRLYDNGYIGDIDQFVKDIYVREAEGPTGMGAGISIPHGKSRTVKKIGIAIGKTVNPVRWESSVEEGGYQDTRMIFLFCVSADASFAENHMKLLSELAGKLGNDARAQALAKADNAEEIVRLLLADDSEFAGTTVDNEEIVDLDIDL